MDALRNLEVPLPTTSVNISGEESIDTWENAVSHVTDKGVYIPESGKSKFDTQSTIIRIVLREGRTTFEILREGAVKRGEIESAWNQ